MKKYYIYIVASFCFFLIHISSNASKVTDSLEKILKVAQGKDKIGVLNSLSKAYSDEKMPKKCYEYGILALNLATVYGNKQQIAEANKNIGISFFLGKKYDSTSLYYQRAWDILKELKDNRSISQLFNTFGALYSAMRQYDKSLYFYIEAFKIRESMNDRDTMAIIQKNIGILYYDQGMYDNSLEYFQKSLEIRREKNDKEEIATMYQYLAKVYNKSRKFDDALNNFLKELTIREELGDKAKLASSLRFVGSFFTDNEKYEQAIEYYKKSLTLVEKLKDSVEIAQTITNIGNVYYYWKQYDKALEYYNKSLIMSEKSIDYYHKQGKIDKEKKSQRGMAILLNNIGMIYKNLGNYKKALDYCQRSITMKEKLGDDETLIFPPLTSISEIYIKLGDYAQAAKYGNRSLQIAQDAGDNKLLRDAYLLLSEINDASKNYKLALEYYKLYTSLNATLFNEESNKQITELSIRYETDKKSNEIVQKANENKLLNTKYQIQRNYFIIIVSLILILTIVIYNRYRSKRRANTLLSDKNQQIVEQHQKLEALFKQLRESEEKLREANITKDKFFQIIAHDLKSPMQSLLLSSDLLVRFRHQFNELQLEKKLFTIRKTTRHLSDLLESLLQWARTQTGNIEYKPEKIDLNILMLENMNLLSGNAYKKNIEIISDVQDNTMVYADSNMITTVIRNLLSNAIKFTPDGGKITLAAHENGTHVEFSVADTGIGISDDDLQKLFRIDVHHTTIGTGEEKGTGLGLILCKEFIEKNNGKITVESQLSKGSMFKFILPKEEINHNS